MSMPPTLMLNHIRLLAQFELRRLFGTPRGFLMLAAFAVVWYVLLRYGIAQAAEQMENPEIQRFLMQGIGMLGMYQILAWQQPELMVFWLATLAILPFGVILFAADQTSSDRARGTLRFLTLRCSRSAIFLGRFVGQLLIQALLIAAALVATLVLTGWRLQTFPLDCLLPALQIWLNLLIVLAPFTALMALASAVARSTRVAISLVIVGGGALLGLLGYAIYWWPDFAVVLPFLPGAQIPELLRLAGWATLNYAWLPLMQTAVLLGLGSWMMRERAL